MASKMPSSFSLSATYSHSQLRKAGRESGLGGSGGATPPAPSSAEPASPLLTEKKPGGPAAPRARAASKRAGGVAAGSTATQASVTAVSRLPNYRGGAGGGGGGGGKDAKDSRDAATKDAKDGKGGNGTKAQPFPPPPEKEKEKPSSTVVKQKTVAPRRSRLSVGDAGGIHDVQATIAQYAYNIHGPTYNVNKDRPLSELFDTAGEILCRPERPIQCVEAAFLGLHLTQGMPCVRFPISFHSKKYKHGCGPFPDSLGNMVGSPAKGLMISKKKATANSSADGPLMSPLSDATSGGEGGAEKEGGEKAAKEYEVINHLVIGLYKKGAFGAMGISRHHGLHSKPMEYSSLPDLIWDYAQHYREDRHVLLSVRLGEAVEHTPSPDVYTPVWRKTEIRLNRWHVAEQRLRQFADQLVAASRTAPWRKGTCGGGSGGGTGARVSGPCGGSLRSPSQPLSSTRSFSHSPVTVSALAA